MQFVCKHSVVGIVLVVSFIILLLRLGLKEFSRVNRVWLALELGLALGLQLV